MMKKFTYLFFLLAMSIGYSQVVLEDFEVALPGGAIATSDGMASATVTADPVAGPNGQVLELITSDAGQSWQGGQLFLQGDYIDLTTDKTVSVDVYSTTAFSMLAKVVDFENSGPDSATAKDHTGSGWETLDFDFSAPRDGTGAANDVYSRIIFFPLWTAEGADGWNPPANTTTYVDNITAVAASPAETCSDGIQNQDETGIDCGGTYCAACPAPPVVAAPTPPARDPNDVISFYSDAYAPKSFDNFSAGWCGNPAVVEESIAGNLTQHYLGLPCQGIDFQSSRVDASAFNYLHFDFYTDETDLVGKVFNIKFVDFAGGGGEASALEINFNDGTTPAIVTGSWVSIDIDLTSGNPLIAGSLTRSDIAQIGITSNLSDAWYDNIYLHKNTTLGTEDFELSSFKVYPNPSQGNWMVESNNQEITSIQVFDILGKNVLSLTPNTSEAKIDGSNLKAGLYFAEIRTINGTNSIKLIKK